VSDLGDLSLVAAAAAVRARQVSPVELTEHYLDRIEATEPDVHAYVTVAADQARATARWAEALVVARAPLGALHGVPLGVKDLFDTARLRTTYGSRRHESHVPDRDATAVARLRAAGAVILGKHATHEYAWGGRTDSAHFGPTHNPHARGRISGGSSGGSAASVAVASCLGALGTDTAGSIRIPAALCGCVGYKPTRGTVSLAGVMPLAPTLDHAGSLARTVADAAAIVGAVAGQDPADPGSQAVPAASFDPDPGPETDRARVAFLGGWFTDLLSPGVAAALDQVRDLLASRDLPVVTHVVPPEPGLTEALLTRIRSEAERHHRAAFAESPDLFGDDLALLLAMPAPTPRELAGAESIISRSSARLHEALERHQFLVAPTVAVTAPEHGVQRVRVDTVELPIELVLTRLTSPFNAAGLPVVSVPVGRSDGLPVAVQVIGRPYDDRAVLGFAATIEALYAHRPVAHGSTGDAVHRGHGDHRDHEETT
jgi:aspartyl-tRNA(Asn)/glutamyl-tRNA(Gln) amidotransferase subunit A